MLFLLLVSFVCCAAQQGGGGGGGGGGGSSSSSSSRSSGSGGKGGNCVVFVAGVPAPRAPSNATCALCASNATAPTLSTASALAAVNATPASCALCTAGREESCPPLPLWMNLTIVFSVFGGLLALYLIVRCCCCRPWWEKELQSSRGSLAKRGRHPHELVAQLAPAAPGGAAGAACGVCSGPLRESPGVACTECAYVECRECYTQRLAPLRGKRPALLRRAAALNAPNEAPAATVFSLGGGAVSTYEHRASYRCVVSSVQFTAEGIVLAFSAHTPHSALGAALAPLTACCTLGPLQDPEKCSLTMVNASFGADFPTQCVGPRVSLDVDSPFRHIRGRLAFSLGAGAVRAALASPGDVLLYFRFGSGYKAAQVISLRLAMQQQDLSAFPWYPQALGKDALGLQPPPPAHWQPPMAQLAAPPAWQAMPPEAPASYAAVAPSYVQGPVLFGRAAAAR